MFCGGGNLTDKITVLENNVDISNVGQYTVTYSVKDNDYQPFISTLGTIIDCRPCIIILSI